MKTISVIGGDLRQLTAAELFAADGSRVLIYGMENAEAECELKEAKTLSEALRSDIWVLPLPVLRDETRLNTPFAQKDIFTADLINAADASKTIFGGKIPKALAEEMRAQGAAVFDYCEREELMIMNAVPTAEGALEIALAESPITLSAAEALIIGYGRIGRVLARRLSALGARVTAAARKYSALAWAEAEGCTPLQIKNLKSEIGKFDIIFNTVPSMLLEADTLGAVNRNTLIIDLASKPGGVDFNAAADMRLKVIWALSLPGKTAPITSGQIIKDTITNILDETEV